MSASRTPGSAQAQRRLDIARKLYQALVTQDPDRLIILRDGDGRLIARHDSRPERVQLRLIADPAHQ